MESALEGVYFDFVLPCYTFFLYVFDDTYDSHPFKSILHAVVEKLRPLPLTAIGTIIGDNH